MIQVVGTVLVPETFGLARQGFTRLTKLGLPARACETGNPIPRASEKTPRGIDKSSAKVHDTSIHKNRIQH